MWSSHTDDSEKCSILECYSLYFGETPTFRRLYCLVLALVSAILVVRLLSELDGVRTQSRLVTLKQFYELYGS